jgi:hypothetical protein
MDAERKGGAALNGSRLSTKVGAVSATAAFAQDASAGGDFPDEGGAAESFSQQQDLLDWQGVTGACGTCLSACPARWQQLAFAGSDSRCLAGSGQHQPTGQASRKASQRTRSRTTSRLIMLLYAGDKQKVRVESWLTVLKPHGTLHDFRPRITRLADALPPPAAPGPSTEPVHHDKPLCSSSLRA